MSMTINEKIHVLQAYKEGKKIECQLNGNNLWVMANSPCWDFTTYDYRVKPEPKTKRVKLEIEDMPIIGAIRADEGKIWLPILRHDVDDVSILGWDGEIKRFSYQFLCDNGYQVYDARTGEISNAWKEVEE